MAQIKVDDLGYKPVGIAGKRWFYRLWEIIPGLTSWLIILGPIILSLTYPLVLAYFIIAFDIFWLLKSFRMSFGLVESYNIFKKAEKVNWTMRLEELKDVDGHLKKWQDKLEELKKPGLLSHSIFSKKKRQYEKSIEEIQRLGQIQDHKSTLIQPKEIYHVI